MTGEITYYIRCDGCGRVYQPSPDLSPVPKLLQEIRKMATEESWRNEIVLVERYGGPSPSLDFCYGCDATVQEKTIKQILVAVKRAAKKKRKEKP